LPWSMRNDVSLVLCWGIRLRLYCEHIW
jgi:hypothetical protein